MGNNRPRVPYLAKPLVKYEDGRIGTSQKTVFSNVLSQQVSRNVIKRLGKLGATVRTPPLKLKMKFFWGRRFLKKIE